MILGLRTVVYPVSDLTTGKQWYSAVLHRDPYFDEPCYVGFNVGGFELGLIPDGQPGATGATAYWGVQDCEKALEAVIGLGGIPHDPVTDVGGGIKVASVLDPFGNVFGLIENPTFDPGQVA